MQCINSAYARAYAKKMQCIKCAYAFAMQNYANKIKQNKIK